MNKVTTVVVALCSVLASARPVEVILDMPKPLIQDHTVAVSLGVRLKDGRILGSQLFDLKDFRAGVTSKTLEIDQDVANCEFSWVVANRPPLAFGETRVAAVDLVVPNGFDGVLKGKCGINQDDEIRLLAAPFKLTDAESVVEAPAFVAHQAERVIASVKPLSTDSTENFPSWKVDVARTAAPLRVMKRVLARGNLSFEVSALWIQKTGKVVRNNKTATGALIEIE